jgi:hypothetical protein
MNRPSRSKTVLLLSSTLLFAVMLIASTALAQVTSGTISGTVKDPTGAVISGATVTISNPSNGLTRTVTTSDSGEFSAPGLYPGTYTIKVESPGFKQLESSGFVLSAAAKLDAGELVLAIGAAADSVSVTADVGQIQLQTSSGERSDLITSKQLNDVAMNGSNVLDYMKLIPGVVSSFDGHASGTGGLDSMNINGTRANQHEFTIDGASNVDTGNNGGTHVTINTDAIEEVKILNSNYQAEFGKAAGGQIAIVTKGGTDQFHGDVSFIHRNEGMNANNWFASQSTPVTPKAFYRYNFTGYTLGGPVIIPGTGFNKNKGKLFFFWSQEFYSQKIPQQGLTQFYTPTAAERQGDFSSSVDGNGNPIEISGPGITNNKIVPTAAQQAVFSQVQKILNLFPLPNITGNNSYNYQAALSGTDPRREDILRIDYQLNDKNRLFGRWIHNTDHQAGPFGSFGLPCSGNIQFPGGCTQNHPGWNFSANLVSTITPTVLNEFSVGPSHTLSYVTGVNGNVSRGVNGITLPLLVPVTSDQSIPDMSFGGLSGVNFGGSYLGATPWHQANTTINVNDNLTWVRHNHTLKAGLFYQRNRKDQIAWGNINGQFNFSNAQTSPSSCPVSAPTCALGDPFASALLGDFSSFGQSTARPTGYFRYNQLEFFVQDTWKITARLTLDYGMRFAWIPPQYDAKNQIALFDPSAYKAADAVTIDPNSGNIITADGGNPLNGIVYTKSGQLPAGGWGGRGIMPEPRFGFAFDLFGDHKTILRGGAGMMHDRTQGNLIFNTVFNNPAVVQTPSVSNDNIANLPTLSTSSAETPVLTNVLGAARDGKVPTVYSFSLGVQHEIGKGTTLDIAYVGTMSRHLVTSRDINAMPYGAAFLRQNQDPNCVDNESTPQPVFPGGVVPAVQPGLQPQYAAAGYDFNGFCAYGFHAFTSAYLLPYKGYGTGNGGLQYLEFSGTSNYNSLQVSLQRRFSKGLTFGAAYTWSKSLTTANSDQDVQDTFNALLDYRAASWDRTHVFAANYVYDLPNLTKHFGGPKWLSYLTDNYQLSGVTQLMTGTPIDLNNGFGFPPGSVTGSDQYGAIPFYLTLDQNKNLVLPTIGAPQRGTRDILRAGGMQNWDMSLFKNIKLGSNERRYLQLRGEAFNIFNHPNFQDKNYNVSMNGPWDYADPTTPLSISKNSNWGTYNDQYSGVGGPRVVQLAAKFYF